MKYLVKITEYFIDPHGTPDEAGSRYTIAEDISDLPVPGKFEQGEKVVDEFELKPSLDGYNATCTGYEYIEIGDKEAKKYSKVLKKYNKIQNLL